MTRSLRRLVAFAIVFGWFGCTVGPQPSPPPFTTSLLRVDGMQVSGEDGAVAPEYETVFAVNLRPTDSGAERQAVNADGSFAAIEFAINFQDFVGLQAFDGTAWSEFEVFFVGGGVLLEREASPLDCVVVDSYIELTTTVGGSADSIVNVRNDCATGVNIARGDAVLDTDGWAVDGPSLMEIGPGLTAMIPVGFDPLMPGEVEQIVQVDIGDGTFERSTFTVLRGITR